MLTLKVEVNELVKKRYRLIRLAIELKDGKLISILCERVAVVNKCIADDVNFPTAYFVSIFDGDFHETGIDFIKVLVFHGAEINYEKSYRRFALHNACYRYSMPMISYFIQIGVDITINNNKGNTPFSAMVS